MDRERVERTWEALRISYGLVPLAAGADKFTNLLCRWEKYISPEAARWLPMSGRSFMRLVGVVEMAVGALNLSGRTRVGGYLTGAWLTMIAGNLVLNRDYDIAVRDLQMALGAVALAKLTEAGAGRRELPAAEPAEERVRITPSDRPYVPPTPDLTY